MKWPLVEIRWVDSTGTHRWTRLEEVLEQGVSECVSVGYLLRDDERQKTLCASVDLCVEHLPGSNVDGVMCIPTCAVVSQRIVEPSSEEQST